MEEFTLSDFLRQFPDDDTCLEFVFQTRYGSLRECPRCAATPPKFHKIKKRKCYECGRCAYQISPLAGTVVHCSMTSLASWFLVIYMFSIAKNGISAQEIQRLLGVTHKTAWRMGNRIRRLMYEDAILTREVEVDETMVGGRRPGKRGWGAAGKSIVFGMVEPGRRIKSLVVQDRKTKTLIRVIKNNVQKGALVRSDKYRAYRHIPKTYGHEVKNHTGTINTNHIEGYWSNLKKRLLGTHTFVNAKYLQNYLNEHNFRYNKDSRTIFNQLINRLCLTNQHGFPHAKALSSGKRKRTST